MTWKLHLIECVDKRKIISRFGDVLPNWNSVKKDEFEIIGPYTTRYRGKRHYFVKGPQTQGEWKLAFPSYDREGFVFQDRFNNWKFTGRVLAHHKLRYKFYKHGGFSYYKLPFETCLQKGIENEKIVVTDLEKTFKNMGDWYIHRMPRSGLYCHGTDITISMFNVKKHDFAHNPFDNVVCNGICAIEVLGVTNRGVNNDIPCFTYWKKDFKQWKNELERYEVLPVVAWNQNGKTWYMIMNDNTIEEVFYTNQGGSYRQRTNYASVSATKPFKMDSEGLYNEICSYVQKISK